MKRLFLGLAGCLAIAMSAPASAYSKIIVFGDSLVDSGNARLGAFALGLPNPAPASLGYYKGRFSNGLDFVDYLKIGYTGTPTAPYLKGGFNFGVGGAAALFDPPTLSPSFLEQLTLYQGTGRAIKSTDLIVLTFGGNDIRDVLTNPLADFTQNLLDFQTGLSALLAAGAKNVLITGIADIGALPATQVVAAMAGDPTITALATARAQALNAQLAIMASTAATLSGADVEFFDLYGLEQSLRTNPAAFGLPALNVTASCQSGGPAAVLSGCNGYLYFDAIHPTTQVHAVIAGQIAAQLGVQAVPEPASWAMMMGGMALMGGLLRARKVTARFA